jgi:hypothetical protein
MNGLLLIWVGLLVVLVVFAVGGRRGAGALTLSYFLGLSLIHVPGALAAIDPLSPLIGHDETTQGFVLTLVGLAAFVISAIVARHTSNLPAPPGSDLIPERTAWRLTAIGAVAYFGLLPFAGFIPSTTGLASALATFLIVGIWVKLYSCMALRRYGRIFGIIALLPILPFTTLAVNGFLGYGIFWILSILAFLFVIVRQRIWFVLLTPLVFYGGLSLFVTYMSERASIRDAVWFEKADTGARVDRITKLVTEFQPLNLSDPSHLEQLDGRLNQNLLVGMVMKRHQDGLVQLAYGSTVPIWALIPRAVWPGKPIVGGGGDIVTQFAGISFAEGTSVGAGQPLEFYLNFGWIGVVVGFLMLGWLFARLDYKVMQALSEGDLAGVLRPAVPGLTLLQPGGNLLEILVAVISAMVLVHLFIRLGLVNAGSPASTAATPGGIAAG